MSFDFDKLEDFAELEKLGQKFIMSEGASTILPLQSLIDEIVLESLIKDKSLHTPAPLPIQKLLQNEEYIRGVLGIDIPLNESYPYSPALQERILQEQLLFEGWFDGIKKLGGDVKKAGVALRHIMEDPGRIKTFVGSVYETLIKDPITKMMKFVKSIMTNIIEKMKDLAVKGWELAKKYFEKLTELLENLYEKSQGVGGWKGVLVVIGAGCAVKYFWSKSWGDVADELQGMIEDLKDAGAKAKDWTKKKVKKQTQDEGTFIAPALGALLLAEDEQPLNEFLGKLFGKLKGADPEAAEEAEDSGMSIKKGDPAPGDGVFISKKQAKSADLQVISTDEAEEMMKKAQKAAEEGGDEKGDGEDGEDNPEEEEKNMLQKAFEFLKEKFIDAGAEILKKIAFDAIVGAVSGGIGAFIKTASKLWGGMSFVMGIIGESTDKFLSKIKDPEQEMEEMEKGEDDPTEGAWHDPDKLIREYVREKLLAS